MIARKRKWRQPSRLTKTRIAEMIERATVDAYGDSEQITGWLTMIEENLAVPFETEALGVLITVERVDLDGRSRLSRFVGAGERGSHSQSSICRYRRRRHMERNG